MGLRIDIGVDADRDQRALAERGRHVIEHDQLRFALDVELPEAGIEADRIAFRFCRRRRKRFGGAMPAASAFSQFAARDDIGARAEPRTASSAPPHAVRLHRKSDQRVLNGKAFAKTR